MWEDIKLAKIDEKPVVIVGYSLGGLVTRHLVNNYFANGNVKGVMFIASPLQGESRMDLRVKIDLAGYIPGTLSFLD